MSCDPQSNGGGHQRGSKPGFGGRWQRVGGLWWAFCGLWCVLLGFIGYRVLVGFIGFYRVLSGFIGFIGFYRASFIGFYRVSSGFILPLFIELPQPAATAALLLFSAMATAAASTRAIPIGISWNFL
jgi:hypothetical protein